MTTNRILPTIDAGAAPRPGSRGMDSRNGVMLSPVETNRFTRPQGGRIPRKGNTSQRAARRAWLRSLGVGR